MPKGIKSSPKRLSVDEREEISRSLALDESFRAIGRRLSRAPSTVSREVNANGGRAGYRAVAAEAAVAMRARPSQCLRTKRPLRRRRHRRKNQGQGRIRNPVMINERPAHVEERIEFGHWEGDLIIGNRSTALATLVERVSRYTILVSLPGARTMTALNLVVTAALRSLPAELKRSLAWDQGKEIHGHDTVGASGSAAW